MARIYYDKDCDLELIRDKRVAVIGYGSQGHAHSLNLTESGVEVVVGLREGSARWAEAESHGLNVMSPAEASESANVIMMLVPDQIMADVYRESVEPHLEPGDIDRKSTRLNSSHSQQSRMPSSA